MMTKGLYSSDTPEWATPQKVFDWLNRIYAFNLDPCCTHENAKCEKHYTKEDNGLSKKWGGCRVYVNPPYGRTIGDWVKKAYDERNNADIIVMLLPARTDTQWFHKWIYGVAEITFFKGRMKFNDGKDSAPFPSMIVVFKPDYKEDTAPTLF